jgi:hypothetical protein
MVLMVRQEKLARSSQWKLLRPLPSESLKVEQIR